MKKKGLTLALLLFTVVNCALHSNPPQNPDNICSVFLEKKKWYAKAQKTERKWGIPIYVMMAIMHQESRFRATAKPPRKTCLFFFPGPRYSSAYGYAQALNDTWDQYMKETSNWSANRDNFNDAIDFIGWYCHLSYIKCNIPKFDAYNLYIAYHEGHGAYAKKLYQKKSGIKRLAKKVELRAAIYNRQLAKCEKDLTVKDSCLIPFL